MTSKQIISRSIYPITLGIGIGMFLILLATQINLLLATYIPVITGAIIITISEILLPYRKEWLPKKMDVKNDILFMITVQMVLPKILTFTLVLGVFRILEYYNISFFSYWPNNLPVFVQTVLMILIADFLRYWLHVLAHNYEPVWKLHAVHHSPKKLYWLNVGRFHPIEKGIQFLLDALPFILLGVGKEVVGFYFVFYAINGFFQHCNIDIKMGLLNYIISGPELHRWHHSREVEESNNNYGNNIIIWDLLFGTFYLPPSTEVNQLGLVNNKYPETYSSQMLTPFVGQIDKKRVPNQNLKEVLINYFLDKKMKRIKRKLSDPFVKLAEDPKDIQDKVLQDIITTNQNTEYGSKYNFENIKDYQSFQEHVPVQEYEDVRELIEKQDKTKEPILTKENPFMFNQTSGTTNVPKYIPILPSSIKQMKQDQQLFAAIQYHHNPEGYKGKLLALLGAAEEGRLETGTPYGSASGHILKTMPKSAQAKYVLPEQVFDIADYAIKYYVIARISVEEQNISYLGSANPSTFHQLHKVINTNWDTIIEDITNGTCTYLDQIDTKIVSHIKRKLKPNPKRAIQLSGVKNDSRSVELKDIWPYLHIITTWTGGSCGISLDSILPSFPSHVTVNEIGYASSEFRGTITIDPISNEGMPTIHHNFFEFVLKEKWEADIQTFQQLHTLKKGCEYYVFVTTPSGLYRYNMNDIVLVTGMYKNTPTLQFIQKGKGYTNITGEKLYEGQLLTAMQKMESLFSLGICFYIVLANEEEAKYELFFETVDDRNIDATFSDQFDQELRGLNLEYDAKRGSSRLKEITCIPLQKGTFEAYKEYYLKKGLRESQFKITLLQYKKEIEFKIQNYVDR